MHPTPFDDADDDSDTTAAVPQIATPLLTDSPRSDGWTAHRQRQFLVALSNGHSVTAACRMVGLSRATAYELRASARGAAFALGWQAAVLRSRDVLADELMDRAFNGVRESVTQDDGSVATRHRYDNQLAWKMLARLDGRADRATKDTDSAAVRLAAADFEQYLELIAGDGPPARAGLFLATRLGAAGVAAEDDLAPIRTLARADRWLRTAVDAGQSVPTWDLDPAERFDWSAEQWARAEAAGLITLAAPKTPELCQDRLDADAEAAPADRPPVWWCEDSNGWRTRFPPPPGFFGDEEGQPGDPDYERELDPDEQEALETHDEALLAPAVRAGQAEREAWFAQLTTETAAAQAELAEEEDAAKPPSPLVGEGMMSVGHAPGMTRTARGAVRAIIPPRSGGKGEGLDPSAKRQPLTLPPTDVGSLPLPQGERVEVKDSPSISAKRQPLTLPLTGIGSLPLPQGERVSGKGQPSIPA